jgi:hypothetical protein
MAQRHQWRLRVAAVATATPLATMQVLVPELYRKMWGVVETF